MQSNRLIFQNVNSSFSVGIQTNITGATVIRASKGTNFPQLVNKGDTQTFLNLFGAPSSQYPGVQEALDFLQNYSLWVSAPGGNVPSVSQTSYYGGVYLTTLGSIEPLYQVTEGNAGQPSINFLTSVTPGDGSPLSGPATVSYNIGTYTLSVANIPAAFFSAGSINSITLTYLRSDGTTASIPFTVSGTSLSCINPSTGLLLTATLAVSSTGITINGATGGAFDNYSITTSTGTYSDLSFQTNATLRTYLASIWGTSVPINTLSWIYNIQQYVIMALYQTSPRASIGTMSMGTTYPVDTRPTVATQYTSTFTFSGSASLANGTAYPLTICGNTYTLTPKVGGAGSSIPITSTATLVQSIMSSLTNATVPGGYSVTNTSSTITITYSGNTPPPSIVLGALLLAAPYTVSYITQYTVGGSGSESSGSFVLNGITYPLGASVITSTSTLATAITSLCSGATGSYVVSNVGAVLSITYPITLPPPTFSFNSSMGGFALSITSLPINAASGATITTNPHYNTFTFNYSELAYTGYNYTNGGKAYVLSPNPTAVDSSGNSTYAVTVLQGDNYLGVQCYQNFTSTLAGYTWNPSAQYLQGTRAASSVYLNPTTTSYQSSYLSTVLSSGWSMMNISQLQNVNIFFDPECDLNTATTLASMRTSTFKFATYITGIKVSDGISVSQSDVNNAVNDIVIARASYPNLTGLAYYCNEFQQTESYNGTTYYNIPIGSVAAMLALIMDTRLGGAAPEFTNENTPAVGGQLNKAVSNQKYNFQAGHLDTLSSAGVNAIILDTYYGLMITSQLTAQSPANLNDWSYLGHQMSFDLFEAQIRQNVMIPQIGKLIDPTHMQLRTDQSNIYLNMRLTGPTTIWSAGQVYITEVNTPATMAENNFMMMIRVKVYPFSEWVTLIFNNVGQNSNVSLG